MRQTVLKHEFVESAPAELKDGMLYVSMTYASVLHKCCCGCGTEVVTPLSPTGWRITFDGETISLHPSVGNWGIPCQSHYWIERNQVHWANRWSPQQIEAGRAHDRFARQKHFGTKALEGDVGVIADDQSKPHAKRGGGLGERMRQWWTGRPKG